MPTVTLSASIEGKVVIVCGGKALTLTPGNAESLVDPIREVLAELLSGHPSAERALERYLISGDAGAICITDKTEQRMIFLTVPGALNAIGSLPRFAALARILWGAKPVLSATLSPAEGPAPQPETTKPRPQAVRTFTLH